MSRRQTGRKARRVKPFAPAILAEDRPECPSHVQRNEREKKCGPLEIRNIRDRQLEHHLGAIRHGIELPGQFREKDGFRIPRL